MKRLRCSAVVAVLLSCGYAIGATTAIAAVQQSPTQDTYSLTCSQPIPDTQNTGSDQLRSNTQGDADPDNPETTVEYDSTHNSIEVSVDAISQPEGTSMQPSIYSGNTVLLEEYRGENLDGGEIVRYRSGEGHIIHRIESSYDDTRGYVLTKGDNSRTTEKVDTSRITHVAVGVLYTR
jgi:hypothetical protein